MGNWERWGRALHMFLVYATPTPVAVTPSFISANLLLIANFDPGNYAGLGMEYGPETRLSEIL